MKQPISLTPPQPTCLLVGIWNRHFAYEQASDFLAELEQLALTAGFKPLEKLLQPLDTPQAATFFGTGKVDELRQRAHDLGARMLIIDEELTPTQVRNLEKGTGCGIIDRAGLILGIFSDHARTAQAKAQVELAFLEYQLPRLKRMWTHLSRERGGIGLKGAGEQEIETDRRRLRQRIAKLKDELKHIQRQTETRRKHRQALVRVALVGYTNAGKSSLLRRLTKADVLVEDKLFATLDTTVRKLTLEGVPLLISDTVGFIRKLPHGLIESFKSTLDEVKEADILLHVIEAPNPSYMAHMQVVQQTLAEINSQEQPIIRIFNKVDLLDLTDRDDLELTWQRRERYPPLFISATENLGLERLRQVLVQAVREVYALRYPGIPFGADLGEGFSPSLPAPVEATSSHVSP